MMADIKAIITDLDGVLTDGGMYYQCICDAAGITPALATLAIKKFHTRDASAARWLSECTNVKLFTITAGDHPRNNAINEERMKVMYLTEQWSGIADKAKKVKEIADYHRLKLSEIAYIGDDRIDIPTLRLVGFPACPADALESVSGEIYRHDVGIISHRDGGNGVLGDLVDRWLYKGYIVLRRS